MDLIGRNVLHSFNTFMMVVPEGIEPPIESYQDCVIPFNYGTVVRVERFELPTSPPQTARSGLAELHSDITGSSFAPIAKSCFADLIGIEPIKKFAV